MAKDPAFLFYSSDFLTGISDLTMEERGQYITLLCIQHQKGRLTKKLIDITINNILPDVISKFKVDRKGLYYNERLEIEAKKRTDHAEKQRKRALDGWKKRKATADATALPLEDVNEDVNRNNNIPLFADFKIYALDKKPLVDLEALNLKYQSWVEVGWKNGNGKKIINWKSTLLNTLPYIKENSKPFKQTFK